MPTRFAVPFLILLLFSGCVRSGDYYRTSPAAGIGWKVVMETRPPAYLVAVDGTECTVSAERFKQVNAGDRVLCAWRREGMSPRPAQRL
jgi:hypothetical protein